jgi:predicted metal-binding membrane protein
MTQSKTTIRAVRWPTRPVDVMREMSWAWPHWWVATAAVLAWLAMGAADSSVDHLMGFGETSHQWPEAASHSAVMSVAMMGPLALPAARHVALSSLWDRRHRAAAGLLSGYLGVWVVVSSALLLTIDHLADVFGKATVIAVAFIAAATWQLARPRRRFLRRCKLTVPLAPRGWRADRDCIRYGVRLGASCVATCWALMAAALAAHGILVMLGLFTVQLTERCRLEPLSKQTAAAVSTLGIAVWAGRTLMV